MDKTPAKLSDGFSGVFDPCLRLCTVLSFPARVLHLEVAEGASDVVSVGPYLGPFPTIPVCLPAAHKAMWNASGFGYVALS